MVASVYRSSAFKVLFGEYDGLSLTMSDYQIAPTVHKAQRMDLFVRWELDFADQLLVLVPDLDQARCVNRGKMTTIGAHCHCCELALMLVASAELIADQSMCIHTANLIGFDGAKLLDAHLMPVVL